MELPNRATKDPYQEVPVKDFSYINAPNRPNKKANKSWLMVVLAVVVLVLLGTGAFLYGHYTKENKTKTAKKAETHKTITTKQSASSNAPMTSYTSNTFGFTVSYPTAWTVGSDGSAAMSITSPETSLVADSGKSVYGKIIFNVVNQGQIPAGFGSGSLAVLNSQDVTFSKPTTSQAAQTYISFVQYPATDVTGGMDAIYVTGNNGYVKDQSITTSQVDQVTPLIFVDFEQCKTEACSSLNNLAISSSMWNNSSFSTPILYIIKSLTFS